MVNCPTCRSQQMNGTLFCSECGTDLQTPASPTFTLTDNNPSPAFVQNVQTSAVATRPPTNSSGAKGSPPPRPMSPPDPPAPSAPTGHNRRNAPVRSNFRLIVLNTGRIIDCPYQENVIVGRSDAVTGEIPDIDLTPDNAIELGVSRRHACFTFREEQPFLTDLGATNRTFINRQVMMRGQPYEVADGDELRFGNVIVKVIFTGDTGIK